MESAIQAVIAAYTQALPGRVRAVYVDGSVADGTDLATSDLDLTVVFKDAFRDEEEREVSDRVIAELTRATGVELDVGSVDEATMQTEGMHPTLKLASALVWGEDIRDRFDIMPIARWTRDRMHAAYWLTNKLYGRPTPCACHWPTPIAMTSFMATCAGRCACPTAATFRAAAT